MRDAKDNASEVPAAQAPDTLPSGDIGDAASTESSDLPAVRAFVNPFAEEAARVKDAPTRVTEWAANSRRFPVGIPPEEMPPPVEVSETPGRPRRTWPWVLVIIIFAACVWTSYSMITNRASGGPRLASVPKIVGLTEVKATEKLKAAGYQFVKQGVQASTEVAQGVIIRQQPEPGARLEEGRTIGYWISSGSGRVGIPDVVGKSKEDAAAALTAEGFAVETDMEVNGAQAVGTVLRQNPEPARLVDPGSTITITVAAAANTVTVPLLTGMSRESAEATLVSMHLKGVVKPVPSEQPGGVVVGQSPKAGTGLQPGASVTLEVSNSPVARTVMVPAVAAIGMTESQARQQLTQYGLKVKVVDQETPDFKPGLCIYQSPAAGAQVKIGSRVTITISRKPTTTTTVPVTGTP